LYDREILVEKWITGKEYTAAVLNGKVLPLIRLETPREFYDYQAKYQSDDTIYHCPCGLDKQQEMDFQQLILDAFNWIGARGRVNSGAKITPSSLSNISLSVSLLVFSSVTLLLI